MNDRDQDQKARSESRSINVTVYGDNSNEIELAALDKAREFFGDDVRLEVGAYAALPVLLDYEKKSGKQYRADVTIYRPY